jgi:hypothetical protein
MYEVLRLCTVVVQRTPSKFEVGTLYEYSVLSTSVAVYLMVPRVLLLGTLSLGTSTVEVQVLRSTQVRRQS